MSNKCMSGKRMNNDGYYYLNKDQNNIELMIQ